MSRLSVQRGNRGIEILLLLLLGVVFSVEAQAAQGILRGIRYSTDADRTRIVIDIDRKTGYEWHRLPIQSRGTVVERSYVDLHNCELGPNVTKEIIVDDERIYKIRVGQFNKTTVRVVLDLKKRIAPETFTLQDPFRVILDISGAAIEPVDLTAASESDLEAVRLIVIDPGHGGKDTGAVGRGGTREKDVVLKVSRYLKKELKKRLPSKVIMTREKDVFIPLQERTRIANEVGADLFVSIHANASRNRQAHGIETYYLNLAKDENSRQVAIRENAGSGQDITDLEIILNDLLRTFKGNESPTLASSIQKSMIQSLQRNYSTIKDLGVKHAPFYVLVGAHMPSVLVEIEFLSHSIAEKRLRDNRYLQATARAIADGIEFYIKQAATTAMY